LYVRERTLVAQRFDVDRLEMGGEIFSIAEPVGVYNVVSAAFSVSDNGVLVHSRAFGGVGADRSLTWFDRKGTAVERIGSPMPLADIALAPDQKRAAVQWAADDIRVVDLVRGGVPSRLTFDASIEDYPVWSPDGTRVLYSSTARGGQQLYSKTSSGAGDEDVVLNLPTVKRPTDWSKRFIVYEEDNQATQSDLWLLPLEGEKKPTLFLKTPFSEQQARLSPDERWIAYVSNETGAPEVYVQSFPPSGGRWTVSTNGGVTPRWRRDGRELFYLAPDGRIMSVEVTNNTSSFEFIAAKAIFQAPVDAVNTTATNRYDVSADGKRFLIGAPIESVTSPSITVVVNWTTELKQ
jgi:eukaryotic-like serine/threonine-protein kinase